MIFTFAINAILSLGLISGLYSTAFVADMNNLKADFEQITIPVVRESHEVWLTAYSSTPEETDDTPFITATGNRVRDGIVATNFLPFGTRVQIPEVFGDKIFVVDDRMHPRKVDFMDIWMPTKQDALNFGIRRAKIVVLKETPNFWQ